MTVLKILNPDVCEILSEAGYISPPPQSWTLALLLQLVEEYSLLLPLCNEIKK